MPKTRAYTREELQGLRRADLQRLCKVSLHTSWLANQIDL